VRVSRKIYEWTPYGQELDEVRWVDTPKWAIDVQDLYPGALDGMRTRKIEKFGKLVTQWEFSTATLRSWAWLLAKMLQQLELAIEAMNAEKLTDQEIIEELENIDSWCQHLYAYVHWKEDVVETLLTETSLAHSFVLRVVSNMGGTLKFSVFPFFTS
jgi:hypothetical protein